jgi:hypothetical protein
VIDLSSTSARLPAVDAYTADRAAAVALERARRAPRPASEATILELEQALALAREGRIDGVAIAYTFTGDGAGFGTGWDHDRTCDFPALVGAAAVLAQRIAGSIITESTEDE